MILLHPDINLEQLPSKSSVELICETCGQIYIRPVSEIKRALRGKRTIKNCSIACQKLSWTKKCPMPCGNCGKEILRRPKEIAKSGLGFCNHSCSASFNNPLNQSKLSKICLFCPALIPERKKFCGNKCLRKFHDEIIEKGLCSDRTTLKRYLVRKFGYKCFIEECGLNSWYGKPLSLEIDHIDGNASNNVPSNLRLICPNCHSTTLTWKGRNRGRGRKALGLPIN